MTVIDAQFVAGATTQADLPAPAFAEIAFAGRSNVGKSSLINCLVQRKKLVRTSSTPGCTRQLNLFRIGLRGGAILDFVDLPGYGYAKRSKSERKGWGPMIEGFLEQRAGLRATLVLVDVRRGVQAEELQLLEFLAHIRCKAIVVATKVDKVPASKRKDTLTKLQKKSGMTVVGFSAQTGVGRDELLRVIIAQAGVAVDDGTGGAGEHQADAGS